MFVIMKSIEREMFLVGRENIEYCAKSRMQKDYAEAFTKEFGKYPTPEISEEYADEAEFDLEAGTAYITGSQNYDWKVIEVPEPYIAKKYWLREDIERCLNENGYQGIDWEIDKVVQNGGLKRLEESTDEDWKIVMQTIEDSGFNKIPCEKEDMKYYQIAENFMGEFNPDLWDGKGRIPLSVDVSNHKVIDLKKGNGKLYLQFENDAVDGWMITCILESDDSDITRCEKINSITALAKTIKGILS